MKQNSLDRQKAKELIEKTDEKRADYYNYYSSKTWGEAKSYHLCIDSSIMGINETEKFLLEFINKQRRRNF